MKPKELDNIFNELLVKETKKLIQEQLENDSSNLEDKLMSFQTLYDLKDKITNIQGDVNENINISFNIEDITEEELINCCGGDTLEEAEKRLIQGLHHDLEENQFGQNLDIDIELIGDVTMTLKVKISASNEGVFGEEDEIDEKKEILLGDKKIDYSEKSEDKKEEKTLENMNESKSKKKVRISESKMKEIITKIVSESVKGLETTNRVHKDSGRENSKYISDVKKKISDYLNFEGNDNPEFPNQIGFNKRAEQNGLRYQTTDNEDQEIDDNRGRHMGDLDYDNNGNGNYDAPEAFQKRVEKYLTGDSTTGNSQDAAGVIKTKTGENMLKSIKRRKEIKKKEPWYPKETVPVSSEKTKAPKKVVNESVVGDIEKIKKIYGYNKKTQ